MLVAGKTAAGVSGAGNRTEPDCGHSRRGQWEIKHWWADTGRRPSQRSR
jgi:hypothetical protein